jgi:hypothetical protein
MLLTRQFALLFFSFFFGAAICTLVSGPHATTVPMHCTGRILTSKRRLSCRRVYVQRLIRTRTGMFVARICGIVILTSMS